MLDLGHLATDTRCDVQIFGGPSTVTQLQWHTWIKPRGCAVAYMLAMSGGAGGGGGFTGVASSARGGGGSGGTSGISRVLLPLIFLPNRLFIQVGVGGQGVGSGGGTAGSGLLSYIALSPSMATPQTVQNQNIILSSGAAGPAGGGTGTVGSAGAAGTAGTISTTLLSPYAAWCGVGLSFLVGAAGLAGGSQAGSNGVASAIPTTIPIWQGTSGAGTTSGDFAGGAFTATADAYISDTLRPATPAVGSFDGSGGVTYWNPFFSFGGGGGSASNAGIGGNGGKGGIGAGGGGGGGGTTGGRGGDGGDGVVIIVSW